MLPSKEQQTQREIAEEDDRNSYCYLMKYEVLYNQKSKTGRLTVSQRLTIPDVKKRLLARLGFIKENDDQVNLQIVTHLGVTRIPYPVYVGTVENFFYLVEQELEDSQAVVFKLINLNPDKELTKRPSRKTAIELDSDGSIDSIDGQLDIIAPIRPPCPPMKNLKCAFCHQFQSNRAVLKRCGRMYGPYGGHYFHLLCAIWCPDIFLTEEGDLIGVEKQVSRSKKIYCSVCGHKGAGLGCSAEGCNTSAHYLCAVQMGFEMNWSKYTFFCGKRCKDQAGNMEGGSNEPTQQAKVSVRQGTQQQQADEDYDQKEAARKRLRRNTKGKVNKVIRRSNSGDKKIKSMLFR